MTIDPKSDFSLEVQKLRLLRIECVAQPLQRRGFMFIQAKGEKDWKYRYAILNRNVLDMYEAVEKGFLPLLDGAVEANTGRPFAFSIRSALKGVSSGNEPSIPAALAHPRQLCTCKPPTRMSWKRGSMPCRTRSRCLLSFELL